MSFKGYVVPFGYMGLVEGHYMMFATESEYIERMRDQHERSSYSPRS